MQMHQNGHKPPAAPRRRVTFVLPNLNRSGGVRVTVEMANFLLAGGRPTRLAVFGERQKLRNRVRRAVKEIFLGGGAKDWAAAYRGPIEYFADMNQLRYEPGEIVIAVGTMTVRALHELRADVAKVRFCHGFAEDQPELTQFAWGIPMRTIAVSATLVPRLEEIGGQPVQAVIPNGIHLDQYFAAGGERDGLGTMFSVHYNKDPELTLSVLARARERWPAMPQYVFGEPERPAQLARDAQYLRYPPVERARELYSRSKIWTLCSRMEGLPGVPLEAMACGAAVISTDNPGSCEIIRDGENGLLVPVGDGDAFIRKIDLLLRDEALRRRLVEGGFKTVKEFSWPRAVEKMEAFLCSVESGEAPRALAAARDDR